MPGGYDRDDWFDIPGDDFDSDETRDSEASQIMNAMREQLAGAGYDLTTEEGLDLGLLAYNAALLTMDEARVRSKELAGKKVGRNAP